ncbi:glycoside hydrolase family 10 protein [Paradesertivirga mongoliensis]|uniref:Glycoside hydrolase family 10 protein n=1 Tax=Paradesertivirga mongoliensis TaxID=2100740 RepID=A0ABW4ZIX5_9SPHI|nr:family 10 glycosylhydrolase [Pedobacter mongoliensis]
MSKSVFSAILFVFFVANSSFVYTPSESIQRTLTSPEVSQKREFRGVWVATVVNIDWPSKAGLSSDMQQQEMIDLLDAHQRSGLNAVMFQVRPSADAFYGKSREVWSKWLTGDQGRAPLPYYDPLEFAITEAHKRGMELHAWFNPYRAAFSLSDKVHPDHISRKKPEWFFNYAGKKLFNPGLPEVRAYIVQVILDVVKNYDIDGVHFDDYFYPGQEGGRPIPDTEAYIAYGRDYKNIKEWRLSNVDTLIHTLSDSIRFAKKHVKFGISPFGIWQNRSQHPEGSLTNGGSSYVEMYADTRKWLQKGWIDYINPQLYWPFEHRLAAFEILLEWWSNNAYGRHLYIGQAAYRTMENVQGFRNKRELPSQVRAIRNNPRAQGSVYFSSKSLTNNLAGFQDSLRNDLYRYPALPPQMLWKDDIAPQSPTQLKAYLASPNTAQLTWEEPLKARDGETAYGYVIYRFDQGEEVNLGDASKILKISFDNTIRSYRDNTLKKGVGYQYIVTAIDRLKNESLPSNSVAVQTFN